MANSPSDDTKARGSASPESASARPAAVNFMAEAVLPAFVHQSAVLAEMAAINMRIAGQFASLALGAWSALNEKPKVEGGATPDASSVTVPAKEAEGVAAPQAETPKPATAAKVKAEPLAAEAEPVAVKKQTTVARVQNDLKRISGIGPRLETVLKARGITSYKAIAKLTVAQAEALDTELGLGGRIVRDGWIGQAKTLLKEKS